MTYKEYFSGKERTIDEIKSEYKDLLENSSARTSLEEFVMAEKDGRYSLFAKRELEDPAYKGWKLLLTPADVITAKNDQLDNTNLESLLS